MVQLLGAVSLIREQLPHFTAFGVGGIDLGNSLAAPGSVVSQPHRGGVARCSRLRRIGRGDRGLHFWHCSRIQNLVRRNRTIPLVVRASQRNQPTSRPVVYQKRRNMGQIIWAITSLAMLAGAGIIGWQAEEVTASITTSLGLNALNYGNWIGIVSGCSAILLFGLVLFEVVNLWETTDSGHQRSAVLLLWGCDVLELAAVVGVIIYLLVRIDRPAAYLAAFSYISMGFLHKERKSRREVEASWSKDWFQVNRIKAAWEVRRAQWWNGVKGTTSWGTYVLSG